MSDERVGSGSQPGVRPDNTHHGSPDDFNLSARYTEKRFPPMGTVPPKPPPPTDRPNYKEPPQLPPHSTTEWILFWGRNLLILGLIFLFFFMLAMLTLRVFYR